MNRDEEVSVRCLWKGVFFLFGMGHGHNPKRGLIGWGRGLLQKLKMTSKPNQFIEVGENSKLCAPKISLFIVNL